jgi:dolichol kinase
MSGVLVLGVLDTAASLTGLSLGRTPVHAGAKKTVEGLLGGMLANMTTLGGSIRPSMFCSCS